MGPDGKPVSVKLDGTYALSTTLDLTNAGILPPFDGQVLKALSDFSAHPTQTLVTLLTDAGIPIASQLLGALPSAIVQPLYGFFDDHVFKALFQDVPVTDQIAGMISDIGGIAARFDVESSLVVPVPDATGNAQGTHAITGVGFKWGNKLNVIHAPDAAVTVETQAVQVNAVALERTSGSIEAGRLDVRDHAFNLPLGGFLSKGIDVYAADLFGAQDLRGALGQMVDCAKLAADVAGQCVGVDPAQVCVGHEDDLRAFCESGLDAVVSAVHAEIAKINVPLLHLKSGEAKMWDSNADGSGADGIVKRIDNGYWNAEVGEQKTPMLSTFTGVRSSTNPATH